MSERKNRAFDVATLMARWKKIPEQGHQEYVSFCHFYSGEISALDFEEYIEIKYTYLKALRALEKNHLFHYLSERALEEILNQKQFNDHLRDVYKRILVLRAEQFQEENRTLAAQEIYRSLVRLDSGDEHSQKRYRVLYKKHHLYRNRGFLSIAVISLVLLLIIAISQQLVITPFFPEYTSLAETAILTLLATALLTMIGVLVDAEYKSRRASGRLIVDKKFRNTTG